MNVNCTAAVLCTGSGHVIITATVGGVEVTRSYNKADFALDPDNLEDAILDRIRSAIKESGAVTLAQMRTAILNKAWKV